LATAPVCGEFLGSLIIVTPIDPLAAFSCGPWANVDC
jgi:hypothetical protein